MYEFYADIVTKHYYGRHYLSRELFLAVCEHMERLIFLGKEALFGRYWGARAERPFLHFEVCFYSGIEDCITRGLKVFEPGAGGEHKLARGFEPTATDSLHYLVHPVLARAVGDFVVRERASIAQHIAEAQAEGVLKAR